MVVDKKSLSILKRIKVLSVLILICISISPSTSYANDFKIGVAKVKITPPLGVPLAGQYFDRGATGVHDDLYAKAMVIHKDHSKVVIVSCDIIEVTADLVSEVRHRVEEATGIEANQIMIGATHTHTGPVIPSEGNINNVTGDIAEILTLYIEKLPGLIAESIIKANDAVIPARLFFGLGREESISFNRRFYMNDGTVGWNPGKLNPNIIKPAGPIDPDVSVLYAETDQGEPIATYVNFAMHIDIVGGLDYSADMPFTLSTILGKVKGQDMVTLFSPGCSGNINHINVKIGAPQNGQIVAQQLGTTLAGEVLKTYPRLHPIDINTISVKREIIKLPLADISNADIPKAREIVALFGKPGAAPFLEFTNAFKILDVYKRNGKPVEAEIQVFAIGDKLAIVSLPGEIFTELGLYIKSRSPFPHTIVVQLANGSVDYIPDRKAYVEGNYEPVSSRCAPGCGEILVENALRMLNELR